MIALEAQIYVLKREREEQYAKKTVKVFYFNRIECIGGMELKIDSSSTTKKFPVIQENEGVLSNHAVACDRTSLRQASWHSANTQPTAEKR